MRVELYDSEHVAIIADTYEEKQIIKRFFPQGEDGCTRFKQEKAVIVRFDNWLICKDLIDIYK